MNYELAKQLKDAGFKQPDRHEMYGGVFRSPEGIDNSFAPDAVYFPALSELIEACGDVTDFSLQKHRDTWWAGSSDTDRISEYTEPSGTGSTPEIAVSRFWLARNKKV